MGQEAQAKPLILVYSEDVDFYLFLDHVFQAEHLATHLSVDLDETLQSAVERKPDAILMDCRTRAISAPEVCAPLKLDARTKGIPVIALMDQGAERDYVDLIKCGIEDTFIRPVWPAKLIERVRSMLDRGRSINGAQTSIVVAMCYADLEMNLSTYRVRRADRTIHLSPTEFKLLRHFLEHPEQVVTREELHSAAWKDNVHVGPRTVDVHVGRLRKALGSAPDQELIRTIRSVGYALTVNPADDTTIAK
ncbi:DNA-binding response regulator [Pelagibius litoralis]|uniref:DNA-binding response regulator n=1 Tax=Pelagibius litoralis TaxID=374515 RepID=A0A967KGL0_9PROT|nr:winged helix-turn-helix domain-containing protein [Pelagibius litoralis]NIA70441.1 DNA-binding response regulator [Pelagibius litoralis]